MPATLDIPEGWFGSSNDEGAFFEWLSKIGCVRSYRGLHENGLDWVRVELATDDPDEGDLRDLIALHHRYGREMRQLSRFRSRTNERWFADPKMYRHDAIFGAGAFRA